MSAVRFSDAQVWQVLANLHGRYPHATVEDALTILEDGEHDAAAERRYFAADERECERELDFMAVSA